MLVSCPYILVVALFQFATAVRAAPATPSAPSVPPAISGITKNDGLHVDAGTDMPPEAKKITHTRRGVPVHVAEGNADGPLTYVPIKNYETDVQRLPVVGDMKQADGVQGQGSEH